MSDDFDLSDLDYSDDAKMPVIIKGRPSDWVWTFAGPGHAKTLEQRDRLSRERLHRDREQEQARVNGRKWVAPEESTTAVRDRNISFVVERMLGWTEVKFGGEVYPFSPENARKLLSDPKKGALLIQALEFLSDDNAFTSRSATA